MAQQFGNTWWGKEWLRSLTHIDLIMQTASRVEQGMQETAQ